MKLKLKVSKTLKRNLKELANAKSLDRKAFIKDAVLNHVNVNKEKWIDRIEGYDAFVITRVEELEKLRQELSENLELSNHEKQQTLIKFYKDNYMFIKAINRSKKQENIIIDLDEQTYYAMQILAENNEQTIETYTVEFLQHLK